MSTDENIFDITNAGSPFLNFDEAKVTFEHNKGIVTTKIIRKSDGKNITIRLPMKDFQAAIKNESEEELGEDDGPGWWVIRYDNGKEMVIQTFKCQASSKVAALRQMHLEVKQSVQVTKVELHELEPFSHWLPKTDGAKYPRHGIVISSSIGGKVEFAPMGGGQVMSGPVSQFKKEFEFVTPAMKAEVRPELAFFSFDDPPTILGFTYGHRWNGWGEPLLEETSFRKFLEQRKGMDPDEHQYFAFNSKGVLHHRYYPDDVDDTEPPSEIIDPMIIEFNDEVYRVFAVGCGMTWNQIDPDETHRVTDADERKALLTALAPEGIDVDALVMPIPDEEE